MFSLNSFLSSELAMAKKPRHPSFTRLLDFVRDQGVLNATQLAEAINETPPTVTNWATRGVSATGAIACEKKWGCPAAWILDGVMPPTPKSNMQGWSIDHMFQQLPDDPILRGKVHHAAMAPILAVINKIDLPSDSHDQSETPKKSRAQHH